MNVDISELKSKYSHIYSVSDDGTEYLFRSLNLKEVKLVEHHIVNRSMGQIELENLCLTLCLLSPEDIDFDDIAPGVAKQIVDEILIVSGVASADFIISSMMAIRDQLSGDIVLDIKSYIISAMPSYTDEELDNFTVLQLIEKLILSEKILTLQSQLAGVDQVVEMNFQRVDENGDGVEDEEYEIVKKPKKKNKSNLSKEDIIKRIQKENVEQYSSRDHYVNPNASDEWQGFDVDLLDKMEGVKDIAEDPLARKLHGLE